MKDYRHSLDSIVENADCLEQVYKKDLQFGDVVLVFTQNSRYTLRVLDDNHYLVSGGWFDQNLLSPMKVTVNGCTWGGSVIKMDVVAACGLSMEFGNRVITSSIEKIVVLKHGSLN
jgi:hypothetical protein